VGEEQRAPKGAVAQEFLNAAQARSGVEKQ
jgi:hypothetical protein